MKYLLFIAFTILVLFSCSQRSDTNKSFEEIQREQDSIKKINEEISLHERSDSLYKIDGDRIMGDFFFGMSQSEFEKFFNKIQTETGGIVDVNDFDMRINKNQCLFYDDKLYNFELNTLNTCSYTEEPGEYKDPQYFVREYMESLSRSFKKKYGECTNNYSWNFDYKNIRITHRIIKREGKKVPIFSESDILCRRPAKLKNVIEYTVCIAVIISNPKTVLYLQELENQKEKREEEERAQFKKKEKSFSEGI